MSTPKHNIPADKLDLYEKLITTNSKIKRKGVAKAYTPLNGHMFSYLDPSGSLALRLPEDKREKFLKKYKTTLFEAYGRVMLIRSCKKSAPTKIVVGNLRLDNPTRVIANTKPVSREECRREAKGQIVSVSGRRHSTADTSFGTLSTSVFRQWPECRSHLSWPGITYFVVQPHWVRYSDFDQPPPCIEEFSFEASRGVIKSAK